MDLKDKTRLVLTTPEIFNIQRIILTGCGDSYAALMATAEAFRQYAKIKTEVVPLIDLAREYDSRNLGDAPNNPLIIAVSNSGKLARMGEAMERCNRYGAFTLGITGDLESVLGQKAQRVLKLDIPKFESAPGTRSYMVCVMALYLLAIRIGEVRGRYTMDEAGKRRHEIPLLADALEAALPTLDDQACTLAEQWKNMTAFDFIGSGYEYANAWFSQAKIFEGIGSPAMCINSEEWLHLNFFMREPEKIATLVYAGSANKAMSRTLEMLQYACQLGRPLAVVTDEKIESLDDIGQLLIPKAVYPFAENLYAFAPLCLITGAMMTLLGERSGRGCEGPWSFSKGAACVRQSKIEVI
ncbi:MAG: SIS domain-containing protein [Clostridia bacterium]